MPGQGSPRHAASGPVRRSLAYSTSEGIFAEVVSACAGATVLTGWAVHLHCSPLLVGLLGSLPFLGQLVQFPAAWLTMAIGHRRVCLVAVAFSRQALFPLALFPWLPLSQSSKQTLLMVVAGVTAALGVLGNNAWVSWMGDLVPQRLRGRYFGRRTALCTIGGTCASLAAGVALDRARPLGLTGEALALLALVACLAGAVSTWLMTRQIAPAPSAPPGELTWAGALVPLRDPRARGYLLYQVTWNAAVGISGAYFTLHMLTSLKVGFVLMAVHGAGVAAMRILAVPLWGRALDRLGAKPVLVACSFGLALIPLYWLFATPTFLWPLALDVFFSGILWAGHGLATFNLPLNVAPQRGRSFYLATFAMSAGLAYAAASFAGGLLLQALPMHFTVLGQDATGIHVLFLLSGVSRALAAGLGTRIVEQGARPVDELARWVQSGASARVGRLTAPLLRR